MQLQITTLQQANKALYIRRKRKRKAIRSDYALLVSKGQAIVNQNYIEAEVREEMPRPKRRASKCSRCGEEGHTVRICRIRE